MKRRILGIDPGSHHLGVGCVDQLENRSLKLVFADTLHAPKTLPLYARLESLSARLRDLVTRLSPSEVAIEDIFTGKNPRAAFHLGMARGVAIAACLGKSLGLFEYAPSKVKSVVTGYGKADKTQVQKMVHLILGTKLELGLDATDALAVAICHANLSRLDLRIWNQPCSASSAEKSSPSTPTRSRS